MCFYESPQLTVRDSVFHSTKSQSYTKFYSWVVEKDSCPVHALELVIWENSSPDNRDFSSNWADLFSYERIHVDLTNEETGCIEIMRQAHTHTTRSIVS